WVYAGTRALRAACAFSKGRVRTDGSSYAGGGMGSPALPHARAVLAGRATECARLDQLLEEAQRGRSAVLVLRGEPGIGKSALLEYAAERAEDCRVLRAIGVEWEMELPFAGLQQLMAGLLDGRERLPAPQRGAVATAFGLSSGPQP